MLLLNKIKVGARSSNLSKVQVQEVFNELKKFVETLAFDVEYIATKGDKDKQISLRELEKTNFFTQELDDLLLNGSLRITIHSAKDLPEPLPMGLKIVALTKGLTNADCIVFNELGPNPKIGTSSKTREDAIRQWNKDSVIVDIRGTIEERLDLIDQRVVEGVVIAECALQRLGLNYLKKIPLEGVFTPLQGRLAVVARADDEEMTQLFSWIDTRNTV
jgi:hydroxymethylbilane synthase